MLLLILAAVWAAVLLPPYLQNRRERRPASSILSFRSELASLQRTAPGITRIPMGPARPLQMTRSDARRRRRDILVTLLCAAAVTLPLSLVLGTAVLALHLMIDVVLVGYVLMLLHTQQQAVERARKVRYLPRQVGSHEPALMLRRSGT